MVITYDDKYKESIAELILFVQNAEFNLDISIEEQTDILDIPTHYFVHGGNFWVELNENNRVIGTVGLQRVTDEIGIMKKFFVYKEYRGNYYSVGQNLFNSLLLYAKSQGLKQIILDSPAIATRSHRFYEKNGFEVITEQQLPIQYAYPDRNSLLFKLTITDA